MPVYSPKKFILFVFAPPARRGGARPPPPTEVRANQTIPAFVSTLKRMTNRTAGVQLWQRGYYDHIIRDQLDYDTIWQYIDENPAKWPHDQFYTSDGEEHP